MDVSFTFSSKLWIWKNEENKWSWYFITLPVDISKEIKSLISSKPKKWRWSVKVKARIGFMSWSTSIFPDNKSWSYLLPVKSDVRKSLHINDWDEPLVYLEIID